VSYFLLEFHLRVLISYKNVRETSAANANHSSLNRLVAELPCGKVRFLVLAFAFSCCWAISVSTQVPSVTEALEELDLDLLTK
jgi:hypothetical protein